MSPALPLLPSQTARRGEVDRGDTPVLAYLADQACQQQHEKTCQKNRGFWTSTERDRGI
jgi:hypothetical protein